MAVMRMMNPVTIGLAVVLSLLGGTRPAWGQLHGIHGNVVEAGAHGDGQEDGTAVFQKLLDEAGKAGGGIVEVPAGRFRINGHLSIPANVTLEGIYRVPPNPGPRNGTAANGSVLLAYAGRGSAAGPPFIRLNGDNAALAGLVVVYPEWKQTDVPPIPYPPCVSGDGHENVGIRDCCFLNPYEAIQLVRAARHLVRNVTGYPSKRGIYVDECYDIGHIENVHFWPFGVAYQPEDPYCKWVNTQGVAFELARTDWHYVHNTFCFGYGIGYKFSQSKSGSANGNFLGLGADSCQRAVVVEQAQPPGLLISNGEFVGRWGSTNSICVEIGPELEGTVSLVNCSFWGPIDRCLWMRGAAGQLTASACHFLDWDNGGVGAPALQIDAGRAIVQACSFNRNKLHVSVGSNVISAILSANQAEGGFRVKNLAGKKTQAGLNEENPVAWTETARLAYQLDVGGPADGACLEGFHDPEKTDRPFRWSLDKSRLLLPVVPGKRYSIRLEMSVPASALNAEAGLYVGGKRVAPLKSEAVLAAELPPAEGDTLEAEIRCQGWVPQKTNSGSQDPRVLGVQLFRVAMKAEGAGAGSFNANTGQMSPIGAKAAR